MAYQLGAPCRIGGKSIVLIEDTIAESRPAISNPLRLSEATETREASWYAEDDVMASIEAHGNLPVYGIWQTLIDSGVIEVGETGHLWTFPLDGPRSAYLWVEGGKARKSGRAVGVVIPALPGVKVSDGTPLTLDDSLLERLQLPTSRAVLPTEIAKTDAKVKKRRAILGLAACVGILIVAFAVDQGLEAAYQAKVRQHQQVNADIAQARSIYASVAETKNPITDIDRERQAVAVRRLAEARRFSTRLRTPPTQPALVAGNDVLLFVADGFIPGASFPWSLSVLPSGVLQMEYSLQPGSHGMERTRATEEIERMKGGIPGAR